MHKEINEIKLKPFKNMYCDVVSSSLGKFIDIYQLEEEDLLKLLTVQDVDVLVEYTVLKNKLAGVGEVNLKLPFCGIGVKYLDKYGIRGKEILSARQLTALSTSEFVGGRIGFDIENLLDYSESFLSELSDITGRFDIPIFISLGRDIDEVGKLVNKYKMSPAEILESFGFLDRECCLYGLNYLDKEDQNLLKSYNTSIIFMPKNDAEEGKGVINLYNFVYNDLKFCFSSGKCYNIDMLAEVKLAVNNTTNLMHERGLIPSEMLIASLEVEEGLEEIKISIDNEEKEENLFDKRVEVQDENLLEKFINLEDKVKQIAKRIKEKI